MPHSHHFKKPWNRVYCTLRITLWGIFLVSMSMFAFSILFPSQDLSYTFSDSKVGGNELVRPRAEDGTPRENGRIHEGETLIVDASVLGDFSHAQVSISMKDSLDITKLRDMNIVTKRSQQAFFYPKGLPATFPSGTLLRHGSEVFLIDPDGTRHRFASEESARSWGYDTASFLSVSNEELLANPEGAILTETSNHETPPDGAFIYSEDTFYLWKNSTLFPFVSAGAYFERFPREWALERDAAFIHAHIVSDEWIAYPSGSLLAWGDGVFIMDNASPRPVLGADIFLSLGYSWDDVRPVSDEEISLEQKGKFIDVRVPHLNGTVLLDTRENRYFLVQDETLREIQGVSMLHMWLGEKHPILVSSDDLEQRASCTPNTPSFFSTNKIVCSVLLENLANLHGDTYEFSIPFANKADIDSMDIIFKSSLQEQTFLTTLSEFKSRILSRYLPSS